MRQRLTLGQIETARATLDALPAPDDSDIPVDLQDAIRKLAPTIRKLLSRGYTRQQVVDFLGHSGINISAGTLKDYLGGGRRKQLRGSQPDNDSAADPIATPAATAMVPKSPAAPATAEQPLSTPARPPAGRPSTDMSGTSSTPRRTVASAG